MERDAVIVAGFGFRDGATLGSLQGALERAWAGQVTHIATLCTRTAALTELAALLDVPLIDVAAEAVVGVPTLTRSAASLAARGTGSVAEACALAAARAAGGSRDARLLGPRHISPDRMATCAIAQGVSS